MLEMPTDKGCVDMGRYISEQLAGGAVIDDVMTFLLQGKFDPANQAHRQYIK